MTNIEAAKAIINKASKELQCNMYEIGLDVNDDNVRDNRSIIAGLLTVCCMMSSDEIASVMDASPQIVIDALRHHNSNMITNDEYKTTFNILATRLKSSDYQKVVEYERPLTIRDILMNYQDVVLTKSVIKEMLKKCDKHGLL